MGDKFIQVSAAAVIHGQKILIAQRHAYSHMGGRWEFPGGKLEEGESFEACLRRELKEELDIEVAVGELLEEIFYEYPGKPVHIKFFRCSFVSGKAKPLDCADVKWVTSKDIQNYQFPPTTTQQLLSKVRAAAEAQ